jgi:hypothetical protein
MTPSCPSFANCPKPQCSWSRFSTNFLIQLNVCTALFSPQQLAALWEWFSNDDVRQGKYWPTGSLIFPIYSWIWYKLWRHIGLSSWKVLTFSVKFWDSWRCHDGSEFRQIKLVTENILSVLSNDTVLVPFANSWAR